jgi:hypothetical protein
MPNHSETITFDDQVVLVSGAGRGIGRCHALLFAERGAHVVVNDVDHDVAKEVVDEIGAAGGSATAAAGDVVDDAQAIVGMALAVRNRLDVLVNNAGIAYAAPFGERSALDMERLVRVHAVGTAALTAATWRLTHRVAWRVVNTTSARCWARSVDCVRRREGAVLGPAISWPSKPQRSAFGSTIMPMAHARMCEAAGGETGSDQDAWLTAHLPQSGSRRLSCTSGRRRCHSTAR